MKPDLIFRKYEAGDLPFLKKIFFSNVPLYFRDFEWTDFEAFLNSDEQLASNYEVALWGHEIIGAGGIAQEANNEVSMCWGMIAACHHKKGFGKKLLRHRVMLCAQLFPEKTLVLSTSQHVAAFYQKYGFTTVEIVNNFWAEDLHLHKMVRQN